jgi:hypothetical protein
LQLSSREWRSYHCQRKMVCQVKKKAWIRRTVGIHWPPRSPDFTPWYHRSVVCRHHTGHTDSRNSLSSSAASTLFSRWWWSLRTHTMTLSLRARIFNYMSFGSKDTDYQRVRTFF